MMSKVQEEINTIAICGSQTMGTSKYSIQLNPDTLTVIYKELS